MVAKCRGLLRHCFFGQYHAAVALAFSSPEEADQARKALASLGAAFDPASPGALRWQGDRIQLESLKGVLEPLRVDGPCTVKRGCDKKRHSIDGIQHSLDYGPPFALAIPLS